MYFDISNYQTKGGFHSVLSALNKSKMAGPKSVITCGITGPVLLRKQVSTERQMPHIRKPSRISTSNQNEKTKVAEGEVKPKVEKSKPKVDQGKHAISIDGSNQGGSAKREDSAAEKREACDLKSACDKKTVLSKLSESASKKPEAATESDAKQKGAKNEKNESTTLFVTSVENFPKDKKVKFAETSKHGDSAGSLRKNFSKWDKHKSFYPSFKSDSKSILPLPQPPELFVPQVGEIAVLTDLVPDDPISACLPCLEANGTYICTPCNPRCFIIQKVRPR